jgi:Uma2 family endonuclease
VPDLVFYRRERLRVRQAPADLTDPPDLAIEIVSPEQRLADLLKKSVDYIGRGTAVAAVVEPREETVMIFRPGQPLIVLQGDDRIDLDDVLPGFELTVRQLFEAVNWSWLDEEPEIDVVGMADAGTTGPQAEDAAASERSAG